MTNVPSPGPARRVPPPVEICVLAGATVAVGQFVGVIVAVRVLVAVVVIVGVAVGVPVSVAVPVWVAVPVSVAVPVEVAVDVTVLVAAGTGWAASSARLVDPGVPRSPPITKARPSAIVAMPKAERAVAIGTPVAHTFATGS